MTLIIQQERILMKNIFLICSICNLGEDIYKIFCRKRGAEKYESL
jgi:hypothetical protein